MARVQTIEGLCGLFGQDHTGMNWLCNGPKNKLKAQIEAGDFDQYDFVMIIPVVGFSDIDGEREPA